MFGRSNDRISSGKCSILAGTVEEVEVDSIKDYKERHERTCPSGEHVWYPDLKHDEGEIFAYIELDLPYKRLSASKDDKQNIDEQIIHNEQIIRIFNKPFMAQTPAAMPIGAIDVHGTAYKVSLSELEGRPIEERLPIGIAFYYTRSPFGTPNPCHGSYPIYARVKEIEYKFRLNFEKI